MNSVSRSPKASFLNSEIKGVKLDIQNQRVINADSSRSMFLTSEHYDKLEILLTYFCKSEALNYKQGLNYIAATLL